MSQASDALMALLPQLGISGLPVMASYEDVQALSTTAPVAVRAAVSRVTESAAGGRIMIPSASGPNRPQVIFIINETANTVRVMCPDWELDEPTGLGVAPGLSLVALRFVGATNGIGGGPPPADIFNGSLAAVIGFYFPGMTDRGLTPAPLFEPPKTRAVAPGVMPNALMSMLPRLGYAGLPVTASFQEVQALSTTVPAIAISSTVRVTQSVAGGLVDMRPASDPSRAPLMFVLNATENDISLNVPEFGAWPIRASQVAFLLRSVGAHIGRNGGPVATDVIYATIGGNLVPSANGNYLT